MRTTFSPIRSLDRRRRGDRGPAKNGLPPPSSASRSTARKLSAPFVSFAANESLSMGEGPPDRKKLQPTRYSSLLAAQATPMNHQHNAAMARMAGGVQEG